MTFTFYTWIRRFQANQERANQLQWQKEDVLSKEEKETVYRSIQQFQVGESSEGKHLIQAAQKKVRSMDDQSYLDAIILFIKEEQRHAQMLQRFMDQHQIPRLRGHWVDRVFRWLRRKWGLEMSIVVLLTAEIIAMVYYQALYRATRSPMLKQICEQILIDEASHIEFQSITLHLCWLDHSHGIRWLWQVFRWMLMIGTIMVVWFEHGRVLRAGGFSLGVFFRQVMSEFRRSSQIIMQGSIV